MDTRPAVLVSSAAAKVLLVQAFQAAGARVVAVDSNPWSAALTRADAAYIVPRLDADGARETFVALCRREGVALLVPTRDGELPFFAANADVFLTAGTRVLVSKPDALEICQDKRRFVDACDRLSVPVPHTWPRGESPDRWPVFVRPTRGASSVGAVRIADQRALDCLQTSERDDLVIQEFVSSPEYSIDVLSDFDGRPLQAVARRRVQVRAGESSVSTVERRPDLERMSMQLCGAIGVVGHAVVQAFDDVSGPRFIEVNPRFGGASNLSIAAGLDSPARLLALLANDASARSPRPIREHLSMLRYSQDVLVEPPQLNYPVVEIA